MDEFESLIAEPDDNGCRVWLGPLTYTIGSLRWDDEKKEHYRISTGRYRTPSGIHTSARKEQWVRTYGPRPDQTKLEDRAEGELAVAQFVRNSCGNNMCLEPTHLRLTIGGGRFSPRGHRGYTRKFSDADELRVGRLAATMNDRGMTYRRIESRFRALGCEVGRNLLNRLALSYRREYS